MGKVTAAERQRYRDVAGSPAEDEAGLPERLPWTVAAPLILGLAAAAWCVVGLLVWWVFR